MARVQLVIPDEDRARYADQAQREGMSLSAWLRAAARDRLEAGRGDRGLEPPEDLWGLFHGADEMDWIDEPALN